MKFLTQETKKGRSNGVIVCRCKRWRAATAFVGQAYRFPVIKLPNPAAGSNPKPRCCNYRNIISPSCLE